jgi:WD40 repeat protein
MSSFTSETPAITPRRTMRGRAEWVTGVVYLRDERHIVTGSSDGSLQLWDLESGAQIGGEWRDEYNIVWSMALSPNGKTIANGGGSERANYNVRLWDIETRKVISKWTGHTDVVCALCWSADGERVMSGSHDGTARVWNVNTGKTILAIKTRHELVLAVMYSGDTR